MKKYHVYLDILNVEADNEEEAKKQFWKFVDEKRNLLVLEVEESDEE